MKDMYGREIDYIRISLTDRCNLRCQYCMPEEMPFVSRNELLSYDELGRLSRLFSELGIRKVKITGGEPLVRNGCIDFLRELKQLPLIENVTVTTNGVLLLDHLDALEDMKIDGINISLDTLIPKRFQEITGRDDFDRVYKGIMESIKRNMHVKINCVSTDCYEQGEYEAFMKLVEQHNIDVRFIEMMPIGNGKNFETIPGATILEHLKKKYPDLQEVKEKRGNGPAHYYRSENLKGCVGFIEAMNHKFCNTCNRIRLTSMGNLKLCLYYNYENNIKKVMRQGISDEDLKIFINQAIQNKPYEHHFHEEGFKEAEGKNMSQIGG